MKKAPPKKSKVEVQLGPRNNELDEIGIDAICERIRNGETYREIAASVPCSISWLCEWLNKDEHAEKARRARELSAEAWLDRGLQALIDADGTDARLSAEIQRARAIAQECARRAAILNPRYSEKHRIEHSGPGEGPIEHKVTMTPEESYMRMLGK